MATSGSFAGNSVTYGCYMFVEWQLASQDVANNRSLINFQAYFHFSGADTQLDNGGLWSNAGTHWANGGRVYNYAGNFSTRNLTLATGSFWVNHYADGSGELQFGLGITTQFSPTRSQGTSGIWALPTIPRASQPSLSKTTFNIGESITVYTNRLSGAFTHVVKGAFGDWVGTLATGVGTSFVWDTSVNASTLFSKIPSNNSGIGSIVLETYNGATLIGTKTVNFTAVVTNSNPVFSDYDYKDSNSATVAVTGNDQYIIQGLSALELTILSADKATSQNSATMVKYNASISSINEDITYTTSDIVEGLGAVGASSNTDLVVKAIDTRGNFTAVTKNIAILPYVVPQITATAQRVNNFETETDFHIEAVISRLTIAGTDKNTVNTTNGVRYRYKKTTDVSWGSWINKASTTTAGNVAVTDFSLVTELNRNFAWNIQVEVTDKLSTSTLDLLLPVGIPIFRIGLDGAIYNNEKTVYPCPFKVGDILISTSSANPSDTFEGTTWVAWGAGRVPVGRDSGQTEFDTVEETGGHKLLQSHTHNMRYAVQGSGGGVNNIYGMPYNASANGSVVTQSGEPATSGELRTGVLANGSGNAQNLQPYIVAYMWKRTV